MQAITSVSPYRLQHQIRCMESWHDLGLKVIAVQTKHDAELLSSELPSWINLSITDLAADEYDRPNHVRISALLQQVTRRSLLINSDIEITSNREEFQQKWTPIDKEVILGIRTDVYEDGKELTPFGIDVFSIDPVHRFGVPDLGFAMGCPVWDYWLCWHFICSGHPINCVKTGLEHQAHDQCWTVDHQSTGRKLLAKAYQVTPRNLTLKIAALTGRKSLQEKLKKKPTKRKHKQDIMPVDDRMFPPNTFGHSGDLGDIIYAIPTLRKFDKPNLQVYNRPDLTAHTMTQERFDRLNTLLEVQPSLGTCEYLPIKAHDHTLNTFRNHGKSGNLADMHLSTQGYSWKERIQPWLYVPDPVELADVIFTRSMRYRNPKFDWKRILTHYKQRMVSCAFAGTSQEYEDFCATIGDIPYASAVNVLDLARIIAGSKLLVCNQSLPAAIGHGIKHPMVMEVSVDPRAKTDCIFHRSNAIYPDSHKLELPNV